MSNVPGRRVDDIDEPEGRTKAPGEFMWLEDGKGSVSSLWFVCPCGCGEESAVNIEPHGAAPRWKWNGNREMPTLSPSLNKTVGCKWHGWLRDGEWVRA